MMPDDAGVSVAHDRKQAVDSSVGRASDCRILQQSDGPWFDSGSTDFALRSCLRRAPGTCTAPGCAT